MLKRFIREILSEIRKKPEEKQFLIKRLTSVLEKYFSSLDVFRRVLEKEKKYLQYYKDKTVYDARKKAKNLLDSSFDVYDYGEYIVVNLYIKNLLNLQKNDDDQYVEDPYEYDEQKQDKVVVDVINIVSKESENFGWSVHSNKKGEESVSIVVEKNYGERVKEIPDQLYHLASIENISSILRKGLVPRRPVSKHSEDKSREYLPRVYVTTTLRLIGRLFLNFNYDDYADAMMNGSKIRQMHITLVIDSKKLSKGTKFYKDQEFSGDEVENEALWTYSRIPPDAISIHEDDVETYKEYLKEITSYEEMMKEYR